MRTKSNGESPFSKGRGRRRVFIVDDHPVTRRGVAALINEEHDIEVCGEADNAPAALDGVLRTHPDLTLIDITLKSPSGIELLKNLRAVIPDIRVLVMSMHDEELYAERALRAGAQGYIMKAEASEKILTAIRKVLRGEPYLSEKMQTRMVHQMMGSQDRNRDAVSSVSALSDRELEVFQLIGDGFGTREIAAKLNLSVKTIDSYREHLKLKLRLEKGTDLVRYAIQWVKSLGVVNGEPLMRQIPNSKGPVLQ